ncbi:MAG: hypothetical protein ACE149_18195 [Armatimonadota bacterium]
MATSYGFGAVRVCTILVHLRSEQSYYGQMLAARAAYEEQLRSYRYDRARAADLAERHVWWPPWRYNDIIAFVEVVLEVSGAVVAYCYRPDKRVSKRLVRKNYVLDGKCAEVLAPSAPEPTAGTAKAAVLECLDLAERDLVGRGWHPEVAEARAFVRRTDFRNLLAEARAQRR